MKKILTFTGVRALVAGSLVVAFGVAPRAVPQAQDEQVELRKIWDDNLVKVRPPATGQKSISPPAEPGRPGRQTQEARTRVRYRRVTPALPRNMPTPSPTALRRARPRGEDAAARAEGSAGLQGRVLGVTFWRLRPSAPGDEARLFVQDPAQPGVNEWTPVRIEAETPLAPGDRVRIGIESPSAGYLYVVNREQYADGSKGAPELIFPTTRTRGGDNRVEAGRVVEIPAQADTPPYFTVRPGRPDEVAEELIVIVTAEPLRLNIGREPLPLDREQLRAWVERWGAPVERMEQVGGQGRAWTRAEQRAGGESRKLTQDEPAPQTVYHANTRAGEPLLVSISLRYAGAAGRKH